MGNLRLHELAAAVLIVGTLVASIPIGGFFRALSAEAASLPTIISYQGRLTDSSGNLLGGSGTTYYLKFSIWDSATVGSGTRVWPTSAPTATTANVRQGVFTVNIGDTANGYPDALNYLFDSTSVYLQVEVSSSGSSYETLSPRQQISSSVFSQVSGATRGVGQSAIGTTTPHATSVLTVEATTSATTALTVRAAPSQSANLIDILNAAGTSLLSIDAVGNMTALARALFGYASSTAFSALDGLYVGRTSTTTILSNATSTFGAGISATALNITSSSASSTFANGINLTNGCFSINGTCVAGAGSNVWGAITGTLANQTDLQSALDAKLALTAWYSTTTTALAEGLNQYFTNARADARINATSTVGTLTSAPNLNTVSTSLTGFVKATAGVLATSLINLASDVTGVLSVSNGGSGWASVATGAVLYGNGSSALATTTSGSNGQVLALVSGVPAWVSTTTLSTIAGTLGIGSGGTGLSSTPTYGQVLIGNASSGYTLSGTSTLGVAIGDTTGTLAVNRGGTGVTSILDFLTLGTHTTGNYIATLADGGNGSLTISNSGSENAAVIAALNLGNANTWTGKQDFYGAASSTLLSSNKLYVGDTATTTILGSATSTFGAGVQMTALNVTSSSASSTFANGILLASGCFRMPDGTCLSSSGGLGLTTLNGLIAAVQTFAAGSSGTDFNIDSSVATHTFNIPSSSGSNRGLLTAADWTTFNSKAGSASPTFTGLVTLPNASSTMLSVLDAIFVGGTATTTIRGDGVASSIPYASTTAITATTASTTNLVASNSFTLGSVTGFLKATAGAVATSLINLASDVTGILPVTNGGTGWGNLASGAILLGNGTSAVATTSAGTNGQVLALVSGVPAWVSTTTLANISGTLGVASGGTGALTFGQGWLYSSGGTGALAASTSPTINYLVATSTTATSTFAAGISTTRLQTSATSTLADVVSQSILPAADAAYDLGSATNRFRDLYLSTASLHLESTVGETGNAKQWKFGIDTGNGTQSGTTTGFFRIQEGNSEMLYINHAGQVGIGISNPSSRLQVKGNPFLSGFSSGTISSSGTTVTGSGTSFQFGFNKISVGDQILANSQIRTVTAISSNTSLTIDSAFSPALSGEIYQTQQPIARFDSSAGDTKFIVGPGGNIGIGDLNPIGLLSVGSGDKFYIDALGTVASGTWNGKPVGALYGGTGLGATPTYGQVLVGNSGGGYALVATSTLGLGGSGGTVSSVQASGGTTGLSFSGGPVTTSGTFTLGGILNVSNGGTGWSDLASGAVLYGNGTAGVATTSAGAGGSVLALLNGVPTWTATTTLSTISGTLGVAKGGTGVTSAPTYGQLLIGNASNGYSLLATSTLGILTTNIEEGSNQYFTNARADARINATSTIGTLTSAPNLGTIATSLTGFVKATAGSLATSLINLASDVTGILPVTNGGTGWGNLASGVILLGNGTGAVATTSAGTNGQVLALVNGTPSWVATTTLANISGTLGVSSGGTGATTLSDLITLGTHSAGNYLATLSSSGSITVGGSGSENAAASVNINLGNANSWTALQQFTNASTSLVSASDALYVGRTATTTIRGEASATSTFAGGVDITKGVNLNSGYIFGAGLSSCSGSSDKLVWNAATGQFGCGADAGAGGGITGLKGQYSSTQTGSTQTFATSSDANVQLTITSSGDTHTFTPIWNGSLSVARGGTGSTTLTGILKGNGTGQVQSAIAGTDYVSSVTGDWTGTFDGQEGTYYTNATNLTNFGVPFYNFFSATTTDALAQGSTNKYYSDAFVNSYIHSSTTIPKTYTANTFTNTNTFNGSTNLSNASSTNMTIATLASTSQLVASNSFTFSNVTGFLKATAGTVATAAIDLANDVTGILGVNRGGTGWSNIASGAIVLGNGTGALATTSVGINGQVLALVNGTPSWVATTTAGTGLSYNGSAFSVNTSQNIATISNLTSNGFVRTSGGNGALSIDTATYLTDITGSSIEALNDVAAMTENFGDLLHWNGSTWTDLATSSLAINFSNLVVDAQDIDGELIADDTIDDDSIDFADITLSDFTNDANFASFAYPFPANATTTLLSLSGGFTATNATTSNSFGGRVTANTFSSGQSASTTIDSSGNTVVGGTLLVTGQTTLATSLSGFLKATAGVVATSLIDLANDVTGILGVNRGGTGWGNLASGAILLGNGTGAVATTSVGTNGQVLALSGGVPTWIATTTAGTGLTYTGSAFNVDLGTSIAANELASADFGDWTCNGTSCSLDSDTVADSEIDYTNVTLNDFTNDANFITTSGANTFTSLQQFQGNASTTKLSVYSNAYFGATATSSFSSTGVLTLATDLAVSEGGTGASTLTGLLQGNGTGAFTAVSDSSTVGQVLRTTGASTYAWGALDLSDTDAVTGTLPIARGGTNQSTFAANALLYFDGTSITATSTRPLYVGAINATTTATSTFQGGVSVLNFAQTGTASSTFSNGIQLAAGCFRMPDGTCVGSGGAGSTAWDTIGNPTLDGDIAFGGTSQNIDANTNDVTALAQDALTLTMTNDAATDILSQRLFVLENIASANGMENFIVIDNQDTDDAVVTGIDFVSAAGGITTAIDLDSANIGTGISLGANDIVGTNAVINFDAFDVDASGNITGITLDTGQGANELFDMDQNVLTSSAPSFAGLTLTGNASFLNATSTNLFSARQTASVAAFGATATSSFSSTGVLTLATDLSVTEGGTGASTLTGLLQGNGTGAFTALSDSSTVGQILRVTGASTYAWGALDLADSDAITGDLPFTNITQIAANSILGNITGATGDVAAIATSSLFTGSNGQALARANGTWVGVATTTAGTGLTYTGSAFNVNSTQSISALSNLTSNGFVKTSGGNGTLSVDTATYLTAALTSIGPTGQTSSGPAITFATSTSATNGLTSAITIVGSGATMTYTPSLSGTLTVAGGGTGVGTFSSGQLLYGNGTNALSSVATSSLAVGNGLAVSSGSLGYQIGGSNVSLGLAAIGANTILGNGTGASAVPTALSTTTLYGALGAAGQVLMSNGTSVVWAATSTCIQITGSSALCDGDDATGGGGASFGQAWEVFGAGAGAYLAPTSTVQSIIVAASSTIGSGTQAGGLTILGGATTTGNLRVQGNATTTNLAITALNCSTSGQLLQTDSSGNVICGTDDSGGGGSLQGAFDGGATIETAAAPMIVTETTAAAHSHDLLQLTANAVTGGTFSGDALQITMDAADANAHTGNGLHILVDQSQNTGFPVLIEDDAGVDLLAVSESGGLTLGSAANGRSDMTVYGDVISKGYTIQRSLANIIDLVIYDTTKDSDKGAWRKSTMSSGLSWYTETKDDGPSDTCVIASDDRCGSSEFPRKAILATTADGLYIFDAKDNSLWMKFTQVSVTGALGADSTNNPSGVGAVNGVIYVGTNGAAATGMYAFDFTQDRMYRYNATNRVQGDVAIGSRNTTVTYATNADTNLAILNATVNDVSAAMQLGSSDGFTVTQSIPDNDDIQPLRGVVLIAAANDSGVSVVRPDIQKVLNYSDVTNDDYNTVFVTSRGRMYAANETQGQLEEWRNIDRDLVSEANGTPDEAFDELTTNPTITTGAAPTILTSPATIAVLERASKAKETATTGTNDSGDIIYFGTNLGLAEIHESGGVLIAGTTGAWTKIITTATSTPLMPAGPRSVFLFDEPVGATQAHSAIGVAGTTRNVMDQAGATAPTFGGTGVRGNSVNFNNNSYLCSDANADGTCDADTDYNAGTISFTVSLWFKHSVTAASDTLFERCYTPAVPAVAVGCIWAGMTSTGAIKVGLDSITTWTYETTYDDSITSTALYNDNQWHHLVYTNTDTDICLYIDGKQAGACDIALAATATMDASQVLTIGGVCSGANCTTGTNFWDGSIDDFVWSSNVNTTASGVNPEGASALYLDGRTHMMQTNRAVTAATTFSASTIGDSGEAWVPNEFVGKIVTITGGTGSGQTRRVTSNTSTVLTVTPNWGTTPDTSSNFEIDPEHLLGATDNVTAVAVDPMVQFGKARRVYVGTSNGTDGGAVTVFSDAAVGSYVVDALHTDAGLSSDDFGSAWSGADADDIQAIAVQSGTVAYGSLAFIRATQNDVSAEEDRLLMIGAINGIQQELISHYLFGSTQNTLGVGNGADLAERYTSTETLEAGEIVSVDSAVSLGIKRSNAAYQKDVLGVVATKPGLILGPASDTTYPVALVGRVPVKFTTENGIPKVGERIAASTIPGYGMRATKAGRVLGATLETVDTEQLVLCPGDAENATRRCGQVMVFVNLVDYGGVSLSVLMNEKKEITLNSGLTKSVEIAEPLPTCGVFSGDASATSTEDIATTTDVVETEPCLEPSLLASATSTEATSTPVVADRDLDILDFLRDYKATIDTNSSLDSEIFTDRLNAGIEIFSPRIVANGLRVDTIDALSEQIRINPDILFFGRPYFTVDTAGFALVKKGAQEVSIIFSREYLDKPIINVTLASSDGVASSPQSASAIQALLGSDIRFLVANATTTGFTIYLNKPASEDISFNWIAIAVQGARTTESEGLVVESLPEPVIVPPAPEEIEWDEIATSTVEIVEEPSATSTPGAHPELELLPEDTPTPEEELSAETEAPTEASVQTQEELVEGSVPEETAEPEQPVVEANVPIEPIPLDELPAE
ncbi:hypothetical protein HY969_04035 [Candidatus Kaiserbacteria bacterium]|nr:hypothetical protein [Candidatus Kaiserbacteria bacterium]